MVEEKEEEEVSIKNDKVLKLKKPLFLIIIEEFVGISTFETMVNQFGTHSVRFMEDLLVILVEFLHKNRLLCSSHGN
jgi:hypothetical protein